MSDRYTEGAIRRIEWQGDARKNRHKDRHTRGTERRVERRADGRKDRQRQIYKRGGKKDRGAGGWKERQT